MNAPTTWLHGIHACQAALNAPERRVLRIYATRNALSRLQLDEKRHPKPEIVEPKKLDHLLTQGAVHQGVALEVAQRRALGLDALLATKPATPLVLLDQVTDPHNVGAILRSAAAFGAAGVITTHHHAPVESGVLAKAASGALETVPLIEVSNLSQAMERIKQADYWIAGMDGQASQTLREAKLTPKTALVMGAEGKGLRRLTTERCDFLVKLPMRAGMESLNVSNACAVALYELFMAAQ